LTFVGAKNQLSPVQAQEYISGEERQSFIGVRECIVGKKRVEHGCCHLFYMCVIAGLRSEEGAFEEAAVTNSVVTAEIADQALMNREHFIERQELDRAIGQAGNALMGLSCKVLQRFPLGLFDFGADLDAGHPGTLSGNVKIRQDITRPRAPKKRAPSGALSLKGVAF
jgi:hypothetical protein